MPGTSEATLRGMLPVGAPDVEDVDYAGGRLGSLIFTRPEDADAAFDALPVHPVLPRFAQDCTTVEGCTPALPGRGLSAALQQALPIIPVRRRRAWSAGA